MMEERRRFLHHQQLSLYQAEEDILFLSEAGLGNNVMGKGKGKMWEALLISV